MRKQYYFRPSERGLLAWDVDRLLALSRDLEPVQVPLESLRELDEERVDEAPTWRELVAHMRLIDAADLSYPIILSASGAIMDGRHRVAQALREGRTSIGAVRFAEDPAPDHVGRRPEELPY